MTDDLPEGSIVSFSVTRGSLPPYSSSGSREMREISSNYDGRTTTKSGLIDPKAAVLFAPAVIGLFRDAQLLADLRDLLSSGQFYLRFPQLRDDLLRRLSLSRHDDLLHRYEWSNAA